MLGRRETKDGQESYRPNWLRSGRLSRCRHEAGRGKSASLSLWTTKLGPGTSRRRWRRGGIGSRDWTVDETRCSVLQPRTRMSRWMPRWSGLDWGQRARQGSASSSHTSCCRKIRDSLRPSRHRLSASSASRWCWVSEAKARQSQSQSHGPEPEPNPKPRAKAQPRTTGVWTEASRAGATA